MFESANIPSLSRRTKTLRPVIVHCLDERDISSQLGVRVQDLDDSDFSPQLGVKERELQVALHKQERYQATVQDVTARMEIVQQKLSTVSFNPYKDMDRQMKDHRVGIVSFVSIICNTVLQNQ